jgi:hypothetical protein
MLHAINLCLFVVGLICFIAALFFMALSNLQVSMDGKHTTAYPLLIGMSYQNYPLATRTPSLGLIYLHTLSTLIVAFIPYFAIKPMPMHYAPLPMAATIGFTPNNKRLSAIIRLSTPIFEQPKGAQRIPVMQKL